MALTDDLFTEIKNRVKTDLQALFTHGAVGTDSTTPASTDSQLGGEVFRDAIDDFDSAAESAITASLQIATTEANGNSIAEGGWFSADILVVDNCDTADWTDNADMTTSLNTNEYVENEAALNITKDGTASATASTSKTTTSRDFTSKTLSIWIYVVDSAALNKMATSNCLTIRFGSDASNYYEWTKDKADLSVGWNYVTGLTSATASTTGSPVITACDYTYVALTATGSAITWSAGDFIMDDIKLLQGTMYARNTLTAVTKTDDINLFLDTTVTIAVTES